jgi:hypothetical protein
MVSRALRERGDRQPRAAPERGAASSRAIHLSSAGAGRRRGKTTSRSVRAQRAERPHRRRWGAGPLYTRWVEFLGPVLACLVLPRSTPTSFHVSGPRLDLLICASRSAALGLHIASCPTNTPEQARITPPSTFTLAGAALFRATRHTPLPVPRGIIDSSTPSSPPVSWSPRPERAHQAILCTFLYDTRPRSPTLALLYRRSAPPVHGLHLQPLLEISFIRRGPARRARARGDLVFYASLASRRPTAREARRPSLTRIRVSDRTRDRRCCSHELRPRPSPSWDEVRVGCW